MRIPGISKKRHRFPLHIRLVIILTAILFPVVAGLRAAASTSNQFVCVSFNYNGNYYKQYNRYYGSPYALVDLGTREKLIPYRPVVPVEPDNRPSVYHYGDSPDRKYSLEMIQPRGGFGVDLYVVDLAAGGLTLLQDKIVSFQSAFWSPDSAEVAFLWFDGNRYTVSVVNADGSNHRVAFQSTDDPILAKWSADGLYLAIGVQDTQRNRIELWSRQDGNLIALPTHFVIYLSQDNIQWSPIGHRLLYQWQDANRAQFISVATAETGSEITWPWRQNRGIVVSDWSWSPNGRYLGLFNLSGGPDPTNWYAVIYRADRTDSVDQVMQIAGGDLPLGPVQAANPQWIDDGESLALLYSGDVGTQADDGPLSLSLEIYHMDTAKHESLFLGDSLELPDTSSQRQFVALHSHQGGKQGLDILDIAARGVHSIVADADDMGDPYWSPDGQKIAVVWASGKGANRNVHLSWANADGSGRQDLTDNFDDVENLVWLDKNQTLAFSTSRGGKYGVEIVDLTTGSRHQLADGLAQILDLKQESDGNLITFWWRDKDDNAGKWAFDVNGQQNYLFKGRGAGQILRAGLFWSPDHHVAALKMAFNGQETLQLASPDGSWSSLLRDKLSGLGDPLWSPDSTRVAFTLSTSRGPVLLEAFASTGEKIRLLDYPSQSYVNLRWSRCS